MPKFPFTNYHELNLDWILKKVTALFDASEENAATIRTYNARLTNAEQTATNAETAATAAQQLADDAAENANNALSVAGTADAKADSALTAATNAAGAANNALTIAQEARQIAGNAQSAAADAGAVANDASNAAAAAQQTADANAGNIANLQTAVDTLSSAVTEIDNKADVIIDSASGSIASFADGADDMPIKRLVVNIEPVQSGSGDPSPTNVRPISGHTGAEIEQTGVNVLGGLPFANAIGAVSTTYSLNTSEKYFTFNHSKEAELDYDSPLLAFPYSGTMTAILTYRNSKNNDSIAFRYTDNTRTYIMLPNSSGSKATVAVQSSANKTIADIILSWNSANTTDIFYEESGFFTGALTVNDFAPYTGNQISVNWTDEAGTVYGGTLDVISGVLNVDMVSVSPTSVTTSYTNRDGYRLGVIANGAPFPNNVVATCVSNKLPTVTSSTQYISNISCISQAENGRVIVLIQDITTTADLNSWLSSNNIQVVYKAATAQTYQLSPQQINTLLGINNIYSDVGSVTVQYPADTKLYIDGKIAELQALVLEN